MLAITFSPLHGKDSEMIHLSKKKIETYRTNVLPLRLLGETNLESADIKWSVLGDSVSLRTFENEESHPFNNGVLLRCERVGDSTVTATLDGNEYTCTISVREMCHAEKDGKLNFYRGDLHTHTTRIHVREDFLNRTEGFQSDMVAFIKNEALLDFGVLSDHAVLLNGYEFFRAFTAVEDAEPMHTVLFPGNEGENMYSLPDSVGRDIRRAGEMVVINTDNYKCTDNWEEFLDAFKNAPMPIGIFAHPALDKWDFDFENNVKRDVLVKMMRYVEMGNGNDVKNNLLHEYAYSRALDAGFRVSTSCGSDGHGIWGYKICPGKTILMAPEKSREAFTDALLNLRAYACESGNVKLTYSVNGKIAPCDLDATNTYKFHIGISYFEDDESSKIVKCEVISNGGLSVYETELTGGIIDFEIKSTDASYFYLRLTDSLSRRTISYPTFTANRTEKKSYPESERICAENFTAHDEISGTDASALLTFDSESAWTNEFPTASIVIDTKEMREISGIGIYYPTLPRRDKLDPSSNCRAHAGYPRKFRLWSSADGKNFEPFYDGMLRHSCSLEKADIPKTRLRYLKFEVLTTVATHYGREKYKDSHIRIGGISLYKPK